MNVVTNVPFLSTLYHQCPSMSMKLRVSGFLLILVDCVDHHSSHDATPKGGTVNGVATWGRDCIDQHKGWSLRGVGGGKNLGMVVDKTGAGFYHYCSILKRIEVKRGSMLLLDLPYHQSHS